MVNTQLLERSPVGERFEDMPKDFPLHGHPISAEFQMVLGEPSDFFKAFRRAVGVGEDFGGSHETTLPCRLGSRAIKLVFSRQENETIYAIGLESNQFLSSSPFRRDEIVNFYDHNSPDQPVTAEHHRHSEDAGEGYSLPLNEVSMQLVATVKSLLKLTGS